MTKPTEIEDRYPALAQLMDQEFRTMEFDEIGEISVPLFINEDNDMLVGNPDIIGNASGGQEVPVLILSHPMTEREETVITLLGTYKHLEVENTERSLEHMKAALKIYKMVNRRGAELESGLRFDDPVDVLIKEMVSDIPEEWMEYSAMTYLGYGNRIKHDGRCIYSDAFPARYLDWDMRSFHDTLGEVLDI